MSWICPWCGTENYQDEGVGRQEPRCRQCKEEREAPEHLEDRMRKEISQIEENLDKVREMAAGIRDSIEFHQSIIDEHTGPLADLRQDLEELRNEAVPMKEALKKWEDLTIFYEEKDRALKAEQDKHQQKLPFEVPA